MRVAVLGAGGVGCFYGARLVGAGEDVSFLARGAHLKVLRERGLLLRNGDGEAKLPVTAVSDPSAVGPVDLERISKPPSRLLKLASAEQKRR